MQWRLPTKEIDRCGVVLVFRLEADHVEVGDDWLRLLDKVEWRGEHGGYAGSKSMARATPVFAWERREAAQGGNEWR